MIGPKLPFAGKIMAVGSTVPGSQWRNVTNRYLGLKFAIKGAIHYGWARLTVKINGIYVNAVLTGYAYETIPGKPIIAVRSREQTKSVSKGRMQLSLVQLANPPRSACSLLVLKPSRCGGGRKRKELFGSERDLIYFHPRRIYEQTFRTPWGSQAF